MGVGAKETLQDPGRLSKGNGEALLCFLVDAKAITQGSGTC